MSGKICHFSSWLAYLPLKFPQQLCDAVRGLRYLHSLEPAIVHGSINPENVLVKDNLEAALCDFGVSRIPLAIGNPCWRSTSSVGYQAKEVIQGGPVTIAVDVYALGGLILAVSLHLMF